MPPGNPVPPTAPTHSLAFLTQIYTPLDWTLTAHTPRRPFCPILWPTWPSPSGRCRRNAARSSCATEEELITHFFPHPSCPRGGCLLQEEDPDHKARALGPPGGVHGRGAQRDTGRVELPLQPRKAPPEPVPPCPRLTPAPLAAGCEKGFVHCTGRTGGHTRSAGSPLPSPGYGLGLDCLTPVEFPNRWLEECEDRDDVFDMLWTKTELESTGISYLQYH